MKIKKVISISSRGKIARLLINDDEGDRAIDVRIGSDWLVLSENKMDPAIPTWQNHQNAFNQQPSR